MDNSGTVVNVVVLPNTYADPRFDGKLVVASDTAAVGDTWNGAKFTRPAPPPASADPLAPPS